jgi:hypothetical protein
MTSRLEAALGSYARDVSRLTASRSTTELTYYPAIKSLIEALLIELELRLDVRASTSEVRTGGGRDAPDFAVYDGAGDFVMLLVEVKSPGADVRELALSTDQGDQVGRYLSSTGVVLVSTVREFAIVTVNGRSRERAVPPGRRTVSDVVELWATDAAMRRGTRIPDDRGRDLAHLLEDALTRHTPIASPETLARVLARQARRASASLPAQFTAAVRSLQEDFGSALGIAFEGGDGEHFFRSSLVQTVYYAIFAGWLLHETSEWRAANVDPYDWQRTGEYLRIPFLAGLFHEIRNPVRLRELGLRPHLEAAAQTLARVARSEFFSRLRPSRARPGDEEGFVSAIIYFYEPFLAAFDPQLRDDLGVWYTPPDIVRYQVRRVDQLLRTELGCARGLADNEVVVLDPACGTGAYLIETLRCIAETLREEGVGAELGLTLRHAFENRLIGFEVLTAPFVVAHLQLYLLLSELGVPPDENHRAGVYLTNALTGWHDDEQPMLHFPELQEERDASQRVKRSARIVVVIGNPPYNRFAGVPLKEEQSLVDPYKGIRRDDRGRQVGQTELWTRWGVRKQLLDDLYVRFFRLAEECIGLRAQFGIVSLISNSSFLTGRSHPLMRESLLRSFDAIWIDNLHGNRLANERAPSGETCETIFNTGSHSPGIKVGTAITTLLKTRDEQRAPETTSVFARDFWGRADLKRQALLQSLEMDAWEEDEIRAASARPEGPRSYEPVTTSAEKRWKLVAYDTMGGYEAWPSVDSLFVESAAGINPNRGLDGTVMDTKRAALVQRMQKYFSTTPDEEFFASVPGFGKVYAGYDPSDVRGLLQREVGFDAAKVVPYQLFPLDLRWLYYETDGRLLNRPRPEIASQLPDNEFLVGVNESRRVSETKPLLVSSAFDLHLFDVGAQGFFAERRERIEHALDQGPVEYRRMANLRPAVWSTLAKAWALDGDLRGDEARNLVRFLFRLALAIGHAPSFQREFAGALAHDWMRLPIPRDPGVLQDAAGVGEQVRILLDPLAPVADLNDVLRSILGDDITRIAQLTTDDGSAIVEDDLRVDIAYFGAAPGGWRGRLPEPAEPWRDAWGQTTGDLSLNDCVYLRHVPERAWDYELGGYPVIKKWLGYREARRRQDAPLTLDEKDHLRGMVQRICALLELEATLDRMYERVILETFTAEELE